MKCTIIFLVIIALLLTACGGPTPIPTQVPAPNSATFTASAQNPAPSLTPVPNIPTSSTPVPASASSVPASATAAQNQAVATATLSGVPIGPPVPPTPNPAAVPVLSAQQAGATPLKQLWKAVLDESGPAELVGEADGLFFVKTVGGSLLAFNAKDGSPAWKQSGPLPTPIPTATPSPTPAPSATPLPAEQQPPARAPFSAIVTGTVIIGDPAAENIKAYDTKTGQKKWEASIRFEAPNRDPGTRFLPGAIYDDTVVVAVSTKVNPFAIRPTSNPEYLRLMGFEIATGKPKWNFIPDPAKPDTDFRQGGIIYGSKSLVVEGPDLATFGLEPKSGAALWKAFGLYFIPSPDPDVLYSLPPQPQDKPHNPVVQRIDITNGKLLWTKTLPITVNNDPPITFSPDEKTAYAAVFTSGQKSYLWTFNVTTGQVRQSDTSAYGLYDMYPTNDGIYLIQSSARASGVLYIEVSKDRPTWALGGVVALLFAPQTTLEKDSFYLSFGDETGAGYLFSVNNKSGAVISTNRVILPTAPLYFSPAQKVVYLVGGETKPEIYAFARP